MTGQILRMFPSFLLERIQVATRCIVQAALNYSRGDHDLEWRLLPEDMKVEIARKIREEQNAKP